MNEGIVMEVYRNNIVILTKSGEFKKLKKVGNVQVGDIYKEKQSKNPFKYFVAAATVLFILIGYTGYNAYAHQIVGYVDITGSKNIRLYVNRMGKVQRVDGIKNQNKIKNLPIYEAVKEIQSISINEGMLNGQDIKVTAKKIKSSKFNSQEISENVKNIITSKTKDNNSNNDSSKINKKNNNKDTDEKDSNLKKEKNQKKDKIKTKSTKDPKNPNINDKKNDSKGKNSGEGKNK